MKKLNRCVLYCIVLASLATVSCAQAKPEIRSTLVKFVRVQETTGQFVERLALFVLFSDDDGIEDFSSIRLSHDASGMVWVLEKENTIVRLRGSDRWIGSNEIAPPDTSFFFEGDYTIIASDLSGNEAIKPLLLSRPDFPEFAPVRLTLDGDIWTIERNDIPNDFTETYLFLHTAEPWLVHTWKMPSNDKKAVGDLETFRKEFPDAVTMQCYSENKSGTAGVLLSPVDLE